MRLTENSTITVGFLITVMTGLVYSVWVVAGLATTVQAHERKVEKIEQMSEDISDIKGDVKVLLERTGK